MFRKSYLLTIIFSLVLLSVGACTSTEPTLPTIPETLPKVDGQRVAYDFVKNSPTFRFDGIEETLELTDTIGLSSLDSFTYIYQFYSSHAGYGDRTDQVLAQVITLHEVSVTVENGEVNFASMDDIWDMLYQEELSSSSDSKMQEIENKKLLENIKWELESYGEQGALKAVMEGTRITATFDSNEGQVNGSAGCNNYFGEYRIIKNTISIPMIGNTEMYCMEPEGRMEQETQYLKMLSEAESYEVNGGKLLIYAENQVLVFVSDGNTMVSEQGVSLDFPCDSFMESNHISLSYAPEVETGDTLTITLCSNPTTGFQWSELANIIDKDILEQVKHEYTPPKSDIPGTSGKETWTFKGLKKGMTAITTEYSQPWEGGLKGEWTFNLTIFVK
ncbi:protease inhibitor I42 family protein [Chloroflexota bacterium]